MLNIQIAIVNRYTKNIEILIERLKAMRSKGQNLSRCVIYEIYFYEIRQQRNELRHIKKLINNEKTKNTTNNSTIKNDK